MTASSKSPTPARPEAYLGLARKYRPQVFSDLVGQEAVAQSVMNSIRDARIQHGHLLAGPRGVGKTTSARILARCLNCVNGPTEIPCGKCVHCVGISAGNDMDVIEIDAASNTKVEEMRELIERVVLLPFSSRFKVYIIDEVHMLSNASFNALLKTLEEPPAHVIFIFATTEIDKIPETVRSRCVVHRFRRLTAEDIIHRLGEVAAGEGIKIDPAESREIFGLIAQTADGGMRDALVSFDQLLAMTGGKPTAEAAERLLGLSSRSTLADAVGWLADGDAKSLMRLIDDLVTRGRSLERFVKGMMSYLHEIMLLQADPGTSLVSISGDALEGAKAMARRLSQPAVFNLLNQLFELEDRMKRTSQGRFLVEFAFLRAATIKPVMPLDEVIARLKSLPASSVAAPPAQESTRRAEASATPKWEPRAEPETNPRAFSAAPRQTLAARAPALMREGEPDEERGADATSATGATQGLAGLSRDELINLLSPVLPDSMQFIARYLKLAVSMRVEDSVLWIQWPKDDRVGSRMMQKPENKTGLERTLSQICGRAMMIRSSISTEVSAAPPTGAAGPANPRGVMKDVEPGEEWAEFGEEPASPAATITIVSPPAPRSSASPKSDEPTLMITEAGSRKLLEGNADFARRARMVRDFLGGQFVDDSGRHMTI